METWLYRQTDLSLVIVDVEQLFARKTKLSTLYNNKKRVFKEK